MNTAGKKLFRHVQLAGYAGRMKIRTCLKVGHSWPLPRSSVRDHKAAVMSTTQATTLQRYVGNFLTHVPTHTYTHTQFNCYFSFWPLDGAKTFSYYIEAQRRSPVFTPHFFKQLCSNILERLENTFLNLSVLMSHMVVFNKVKVIGYAWIQHLDGSQTGIRTFIVQYSLVPPFHLHSLFLPYQRAKFTSKAAKQRSLMQRFGMCRNLGCETCVRRFFWVELLVNVSERDTPGLWPPSAGTTSTLPLSRSLPSHHMAEVSQHSIPYWAKLRLSLLGLNLGFRGADLAALPPPACCEKHTLHPHNSGKFSQKVSMRILSVLLKKEGRCHSAGRRERTDHKGGKVRLLEHWLPDGHSAVALPGGICCRDQSVTWESLSITERTISVRDNHTRQWGFIRRMTARPSLVDLCLTPWWAEQIFHTDSQQRRERQV